MKHVSSCFDTTGVMLPLALIHPIRRVTASDSAFGKYRSILASIREVGLIEPLVVYPQKDSAAEFVLLDGHLRYKALQELGKTEAPCLVSKAAEPYTYNDKVNRLSLIQEHAMITRALQRGVTTEQIAKALAIDTSRVRNRLNLVNGVDPAAVELLKDRPITAGALQRFRKVKPLRQVEMAQLMVSANTYTTGYSDALVVGTPPELLVDAKKQNNNRHGMSVEEFARLQQEMGSLEREYRQYEEQFGENSLQLNAAQRYVKRLLQNARVKRFLGANYPELRDELEALATADAV